MQRAQVEFMRLVKEKAEDEKISLSEAFVRVGREHPELASAYRDEVVKSDAVDITPTPELQEPPQGPAQREFRRLMAAEMRSEGVTCGEALTAVARARPTLVAAYRREVTGARE
jgi:hypothetical protein